MCDDGSVEELFEGLACGEVEVLGNFQLSSDDPRNYTDKISILTQTRYFPEEQYPSGSDPDHQAATATSVSSSATSDPSQAGAVAGPSTSQAGASAASLPDLDPAVKEMNETLISMHHNLVKLLEKAGVKKCLWHVSKKFSGYCFTVTWSKRCYLFNLQERFFQQTTFEGSHQGFSFQENISLLPKVQKIIH